MNRQQRIAAAKDALLRAQQTPEALCTGTEENAFVRVMWGEMDCTQEFPARDGSHARRIVALINGE